MLRRQGFSLRQSTQEEIAGWLFASPWIIGFLLLTLGPMLFSLAMSFARYDMFNAPRWIGLDNFAHMVKIDNLVLHSLKVTTLYALMSVPLHLIFGFALALLLNQKVQGLSIWRTIFYLPSVVSGISVLILWILVLNPQFGLFNSLLAYVGIQGPNWLGAPEWALPSLVIMSLWGVGSTMLVYLAGLQGIPTELYEAAQVDGANELHRLVKITLPMMSPVIFFNLIMGIIHALQSFNNAYLMTQGGPAWATYFFMLHLFTKAFEELKMGYASALAWVLFIYILLLTLLVIRWSTAFVYYEYALRKAK
jgi:multiple sugar transport system permease protein